jgi:hypothetical protein
VRKAKAHPPYRVESEGGSDQWIVDSAGNDVVTKLGISKHYASVFGERIMQIICDGLNADAGKEPA